MSMRIYDGILIYCLRHGCRLESSSYVHTMLEPYKKGRFE
jgi:hypothetical protein